MDFFEHQDRARRNTSLLVLYFFLAVALIVVAIYIVVLIFIVGLNRKTEGIEVVPVAGYWDPEIFAYSAGATLIIILLGTLYKTIMLSSGGSVVAGMFGGLPIPTDTTETKLRRLLNVVEEMSLASGVPVPPVFLLEEKGINAFAAGFKPEDAVIAVSRGAVEQLNRAELQGVIAHEFSHILNGDMRTNIRMMGVLHGILLIAMIGYLLFRGSLYGGSTRSYSRDSNRGGGGGQIVIILIGLSLMAIGYIGVFFGKLIKSAVSRQREFLADASAVQFTRYPQGISGALKKIGGFDTGSRIRDPHAEEASHFFFANALGTSFFQLLATHPPLVERIKRLDPEFDGDFNKYQRESLATQEESGISQISPAMPLPEKFQATPQEVVERVGSPTARHIEYARGIREAIPDPLLESTHDAYGARALVYALLLDRNPEVREQQFKSLRSVADPMVYRDTVGLQKALEGLDQRYRLPLIDLAIPALSNLSEKQYETFSQNVKTLIDADHRVNLFEFALQNLLTRHLAPKFGITDQVKVRFTDLKPVIEECQTLLSALAHAGSRKETEVALAFEEAQRKLAVIGKHLTLRPRNTLSLSKIKESLDRLAQVAPLAKKRLVEACATAVIRDGEITLVEAELLRVVCDSLGCPMPPILARI
ncbi:MAG: M48 family metallopeptidase [Candidatus Omnitrophica bacterium]|nr:M48 family metallopeptidase [Candidatus Omnitrophota bacterium]